MTATAQPAERYEITTGLEGAAKRFWICDGTTYPTRRMAEAARDALELAIEEATR